MSFSIGIVGLPNVGKSTLFKALTRKQVDAANYPFCTIDPNVGVVPVPDERLDQLAKVSKSEKIVPTTIEFIDIAGIVEGVAESLQAFLPTNLYLTTLGIMIGYALFLCLTLLMIYQFTGMKALSGKNAGLKMTTFFLVFMGLVTPILNFFPWLIFWTLTVWRNPK